MSVLNGIRNFLQFINDNWTVVVVIIGLIIAIYKKAKYYFSKSNEEKVEIAKKQIRETILKMVTDAEVDYETWAKAGAIKRAKVIEEIFVMYPILAKVTNQEELISWIDKMIDEALKTMRDIFKENLEQTVESATKQ